jgi:cellulose synthase/poly-beta-1,6-N-acetylglucosamine synthase-like glycosyltransferase
MPFLFNPVDGWPGSTATLCTVGLALLAIILNYEISVDISSQFNRSYDASELCHPCLPSIFGEHEGTFLRRLWCFVHRRTSSHFITQFAAAICDNCNCHILIVIYSLYIITAVSSALTLSFILLRSVLPGFYTPILTICSFLIWRPVLSIILSALSYKSFQIWYPSLIGTTALKEPWFLVFFGLATFKFLKVFVHTVSFHLLTSPAPQPLNPTLSPRDVTVVIPSVGEFDNEFIECIETILANDPRRVIVCTVGLAKLTKAKQVCSNIGFQRRKGNITVLAITESNKRAQFLRSVSAVQTQIVAYADDHVFWPPTFLKSALAPFEDQRVGLVGTVKKVRRDRSGGLWKSFMNYIACLYLERHNFECTASYNLDGGVFVISGRTALTRTSIVHRVDFRREFLNETWLWGTVGPLKVDDDNFITRWMVNHGWKTVFHNSPDAVVETTLGTTGGLQKFRGQLIRWVRTTWRANSTSLFSERVCWTIHPWTTYAMFISSFFNIALIYDPLLILTLYRSGHTQQMYTLLFALLISKLIKPLEHIRKEPRDIVFLLPMGLLFGYVHSLFKIWALFTARNIAWSGRKGIK